MNTKAKKAGGVAGLAIAVLAVGAIASSMLGLKLPEAPGTFNPEGAAIVGQGFDTTTDQWYFYLANCAPADRPGVQYTLDQWLATCGDNHRIVVTEATWMNFVLGGTYSTSP